MNKHELRGTRAEIVEYVRCQLIGPNNGIDEVLPEANAPQYRYLMGKLYPVDTEIGESEDDPEADDQGGVDDGDEWSESPIALAFQRLPASMGLSFFLRGEISIGVTAHGARYESQVFIDVEFCWSKSGDTDARDELNDLDGLLAEAGSVLGFSITVTNEEFKALVRVEVETVSNEAKHLASVKKLLRDFEFVSLKPVAELAVEKSWKRLDLGSKPLEYSLTPEMTSVDPVLGGGASLQSYWRPMKGGYLVTVTLVNLKKTIKGNWALTQDCLFQVGLEICPAKGAVTPYPRTYAKSRGEEEEELDVVFRDNVSYAVGHGCSVEWSMVDRAEVELLRTVYLPSKEVPDVSPEIDGIDLEVMSLQFLANEKIQVSDLCNSLMLFVGVYEAWFEMQEHDEVPADLELAKRRILGRIENASQRMKKGIELLKHDPMARKVFALANRAMLMQMAHAKYKKRAKGQSEVETPDYFGEAYNGIRWRPFQLAFQLLAIDSVLNEDSKERDIVDLIWFPTGGGKTEAYLVLAAMEIFHRRLKYKEAGYGTAVLKRYTIRLLTSQQFERASRLICACEVLRSELPELGAEPITLGLWVGEGSSPNAFTTSNETGSLERHNAALNDENPKNFFSLTACPWCGTTIYPKTQEENSSFYGTRASQTTFEIFCPDERCRFHRQLPVNVVDEYLYENPPTFVVATVDKLARAAWDWRSRSLFGFRSSVANVRPPSLIIQDELHLISGPLGTVAGIYESAFDVLMKRPKIIAATATIRRAKEQVRQLYGRGLNIFPPSGLRASDSFYSRHVPLDESPGRLYVGCMGQGTTAVYSQVQLCAAIALAPVELGLEPENGDGYWTQVIFHNSRRELGKTMTLARDDIPSRIELVCKDQSRLRKLNIVKELSANCTGEEIPKILDDLNVKMGDAGAIDVLPCTNMLSVGVDIQRLGLMTVNGQPKTTAEYIQASSRVGRGDTPGLVFAHYASTKPRDRSHYETFYSYHDALYRAVEPTSVTPYAEPALIRALHAALVIVMRHGAGLSKDADARKFDPYDANQKKWLDQLKMRIEIAAPEDQRLEALGFLDQRISEWRAKAEASRNGGAPLKYDARTGAQFDSLICSFEKKKEGVWSTLNSMRHVDPECLIKVFGEGIQE
jgi:hypothetical protein